MQDTNYSIIFNELSDWDYQMSCQGCAEHQNFRYRFIYHLLVTVLLGIVWGKYMFDTMKLRCEEKQWRKHCSISKAWNQSDNDLDYVVIIILILDMDWSDNGLVQVANVECEDHEHIEAIEFAMPIPAEDQEVG